VALTVNPHDIESCMGPHPAVDDPVLLAVLKLVEQHLTLGQLADALNLYTDSKPYRRDRNGTYRFHQREDKARHLVVLARERGHPVIAEMMPGGTTFTYKETP
jgi:hypothetical protein